MSRNSHLDQILLRKQMPTSSDPFLDLDAVHASAVAHMAASRVAATGQPTAVIVKCGNTSKSLLETNLQWILLQLDCSPCRCTQNINSEKKPKSCNKSENM